MPRSRCRSATRCETATPIKPEIIERRPRCVDGVVGGRLATFALSDRNEGLQNDWNNPTVSRTSVLRHARRIERRTRGSWRILSTSALSDFNGRGNTMAHCVQGFRFRNVALLLFVGLLGISVLHGETVESRNSEKSERSEVSDTASKKEYRIREGFKLDSELGEFREAGERITFYPSGDKTSFVAIENLALERVSRVLDENTSPRTWSVSGIVTEYRGGNYLIVTRASLKTRARRGTKVSR